MPKFKRKIYIKDESFDPIYSSVNFNFFVRSRILPGIFVALGVLILVTQVVIPLIFFKTHERVSADVASSVLGVATGFDSFEFKELTPVKSKKPVSIVMTGNIPKFFYLSVPKLNIKNAVVETNSTDLSPEDRLGHYNGSSLPGDKGNTFIYGHSVLPWFFNPKNYKTIFSTLDELEEGDQIIVTYNNNKIVYRVEYQEIVKTELVDPLSEFKPDYLNQSTLTLMTCWPAGSRSKRLMVRAVKVD